MAVGSAAEVWWMFFVKKVGEGVEAEAGMIFVGGEVDEGIKAEV